MTEQAGPSSGDVLRKAKTGIQGFDEISFGGLPRGRATLVCGSPGSGKTLFAMEFLVRGALEQGEPGVFVSFEESTNELICNVESLGFDLRRLADSGMLAIDHVRLERSEIEETGEYDLDGLFIRLGYAIDKIGAKRVALDTIEGIFSALSDETIIRAELRRLFRWFKDRGLTVVITGERGDNTLTRQGLEEYVSDCVILLEQRVHERITTRHMRIVKYRGSAHGGNEYPFLIQENGISVLPITSLGLDHPASNDRISLGIPRLDNMLGSGKGVYRGTSVLVSGTAGTGKSSISAHAVDAACRRGERVLYFAFEESRQQITRNMRSIGIDLEPWWRAGLLRFQTSRPTVFGLEMHLVAMHQQIETWNPQLCVFDPISNLTAVGALFEVRSMLTRLIDFLKSRQTTALFINLTPGAGFQVQTEVGVSSLMDTWLMLSFIETNGERNRVLQVLKSRGMEHSNQAREFILTDRGVDLLDIYVGVTGGVILGAARKTQEAREQAETVARERRIARMKREISRGRQNLDAELASLRADFEAKLETLMDTIAEEHQEEALQAHDRREMARIRQADPVPRGGETQEGPIVIHEDGGEGS